MIIGDLNIRFQGRRADEEHTMGPYWYGRRNEFLETCEAKSNIPSSRELMMDTMNSYDFVVANTWHQTSQDKSPIEKFGQI